MSTSLDRKIYSFFKKGVYDSYLSVERIFPISVAEQYALRGYGVVTDAGAGACKFGLLGSILVESGALVAEAWGGYSKTRLSGGQATGQVGAHYFEFITDAAVANCPATSVIQLASWMAGNLSTENGFITFRDYGSVLMGNLFNIMDITSGTGKLWFTNTLKIRIGSAAKYIPMSTIENQLILSSITLPDTGADDYGLSVPINVAVSDSGACKFATYANAVLNSGALVAEIWGGYSRVYLLAGQATGQIGAHYFEMIVNSAVANAPSTSVIQLASWINGNLNLEHGFIQFRDYGSKPMTNLLHLGAEITSGTGKLWYNSTLKIRIGSAAKYLTMSDVENPFTIASGLITTYGNLVLGSGVVTGTALRINKTANTAGTMLVHCHQLADPGEDYTINDFKGEALHVANGMIGIGSSWVLDVNSVGSLYGVMSTVFLGNGRTLSGVGAMGGVSGGVAITAGIVNGADVILSGVIGGMVQSGGTITLCKYVSALWASSMLQVTPTAGESQLLLMTCSNAGATLNQAIYVDAGDKISEFAHFVNCATMISAKTDADVAYAHYRKLLVTVDGLPGWIYIEMAA